MPSARKSVCLLLYQFLRYIKHEILAKRPAGHSLLFFEFLGNELFLRKFRGKTEETVTSYLIFKALKESREDVLGLAVDYGSRPLPVERLAPDMKRRLDAFLQRRRNSAADRLPQSSG